MADDDRPVWETKWLGEMPDLTELPMDYQHGDEHFRFDNGELWAVISVCDGAATIHEFYAHDQSLADARTGIGRRALELLRPHFTHVMAGGVGDPNVVDPETGEKSYAVQPSFLFWRGMLRDGLVDEIDLMICGTSVTREMLGETFVTLTGVTVEPDERDLASAFRP
jgi:hypothetical protein